MFSHGAVTLAVDNSPERDSAALDNWPRQFPFSGQGSRPRVSNGLAQADDERSLVMPLIGAPPPKAMLRQRDPVPRLAVGLTLYLISSALVATATIAVFFGVAFLLLLQPAGETFPGAGWPSPVAQIAPLIDSLWASWHSSQQPIADKSEPVAFSPSMAGSNAATAASSIIPVAARPTEPEALPLRANDAAGTNYAAQPSVSPLVPETVPQAEVALSGGESPAVASTRGTAADSAVPPDPAPLSRATPIDPGLSAADIADLLDHGDALLRIGDIASARLFYERAAAAGNGRAALHLGASFDPVFLGRAGFSKMQADAAQAHFWYNRAVELGAAEAKRLLTSVDSKQGQ